MIGHRVENSEYASFDRVGCCIHQEPGLRHDEPIDLDSASQLGHRVFPGSDVDTDRHVGPDLAVGITDRCGCGRHHDLGPIPV